MMVNKSKGCGLDRALDAFNPSTKGKGIYLDFQAIWGHRKRPCFKIKAINKSQDRQVDT